MNTIKLILGSGLVLLAILITQGAELHTWHLLNGQTIDGSYFTAGTTMVVVKSHGTNCLINMSNLGTNDLIYAYQCKTDAIEKHLQIEAAQMAQAGMVEATVVKIKNFPESVNRGANGPRCWMDGKFIREDSSFIADPDFYLAFTVEDKAGDEYFYCHLPKEIQGQPNPLLNIISGLKNGDRIRMTGSLYLDLSNSEGIFDIDGISLVQTAAEQAKIEALKDIK